MSACFKVAIVRAKQRVERTLKVSQARFQEVFESRYNTDVNNDGRRGVHAHNLWLHQFAETGLLGGALYLMLWLRILVLSWRSARERPAFLSVGVFLSIVGILGSNLTTNMFFLTGGASGRIQSMSWMLFGLAAVLHSPSVAQVRSAGA